MNSLPYAYFNSDSALIASETLLSYVCDPLASTLSAKDFQPYLSKVKLPITLTTTCYAYCESK